MMDTASMRHCALPLCLWLVCLTPCRAGRLESPAANASVLSQLTRHYIHISGTLAKDSLDGVPSDAHNIAELAPRIGVRGKAIQDVALQLASELRLRESRSLFAALSRLIIEAWGNRVPPGLAVGYCPMRDARWIQNAGEIANPYFGAAMRHCGSIDGKRSERDF